MEPNSPQQEGRPGNPFFKSMVLTLPQPSQVVCSVRGKCDASPGTFFRLLLKWPDGRVDTVSHTMANPSAPNGLQVGASLYLPAGTYTWTAQLGLSVGGGPAGGDIDNFQPQALPPEAVLQGQIGTVTVFGHSDGWFLASCARDCMAFGDFTVSGSIANGTTLTATVLLQQEGGALLQSYPAEIRAPGHPQLKIEMVPCGSGRSFEHCSAFRKSSANFRLTSEWSIVL